MTVHQNSGQAYKRQSGKLSNRQAMILELFKAESNLTDREILVRLVKANLLPLGADINSVRPRITELIKAGHLRESGTKIDEVSKTHVRACSLSGRLF